MLGKVLRESVRGARKVRRLWVWIVQLGIVHKLVVDANVLRNFLLIENVLASGFGAHFQPFLTGACLDVWCHINDFIHGYIIGSTDVRVLAVGLLIERPIRLHVLHGLLVGVAGWGYKNLLRFKYAIHVLIHFYYLFV